MIHTKRLFLADLSPKHLTMLQRGVEWCHDCTVEKWLEDINSGLLALFEVEEVALIGLRKLTDRVWIELLVGRGIKKYGPEALEWVCSLHPGLPVELGASRDGLLRYYQRTLGFRPVNVIMRLD